MKTEILPFSETNIGHDSTGQPISLGCNRSLPAIVAATFGWEAVNIKADFESGETLYFGACRKGRKIVLLPMFSYGPNARPEIAGEILKSLKSQGYSCEWRLTVKASEFVYTNKVATILSLTDDEEQQFGRLKPNVRRKIRKCSSNGIRVIKGGMELLAGFYEVYSIEMHRLGSPALPKRWFANLLEKYRYGEASVWCAYLDNHLVGTAFLLENELFFEACWFATLNKYNKYYTSYGLYWAMIRHAIHEKGLWFSFGRSSYMSGVHIYKQQWGSEDIPLFWNYSNEQPKNIRSFTMLNKLWGMLPFQVAKIVGPWISGRFY